MEPRERSCLGATCRDFVRASEGGGVFGAGGHARLRRQRHPLWAQEPGAPVVMAQPNGTPKTPRLPILQPDQLGLGDALGLTGDHGAAAGRPEQGLWPPDKLVGLGQWRGGRCWPMDRRPREALCLVPSYLSLSPCRFPLGETKPRALQAGLGNWTCQRDALCQAPVTGPSQLAAQTQTPLGQTLRKSQGSERSGPARPHPSDGAAVRREARGLGQERAEGRGL